MGSALSSHEPIAGKPCLASRQREALSPATLPDRCLHQSCEHLYIIEHLGLQEIAPGDCDSTLHGLPQPATLESGSRTGVPEFFPGYVNSLAIIGELSRAAIKLRDVRQGVR